MNQVEPGVAGELLFGGSRQQLPGPVEIVSAALRAHMPHEAGRSASNNASGATRRRSAGRAGLVAIQVTRHRRELLRAADKSVRPRFADLPVTRFLTTFNT